MMRRFMSFELQNEKVMAGMKLVFQTENLDAAVEYVKKHYPSFSSGATIACLDTHDQICMT